jgi:hypothetical protein
MTEDLSQKIMEKITEEKVTPRPRWRFLLENYVVWALFGLAVIIGSLAVATMIAMADKHDWGAYQYINRSPFAHLLVSLPYLWFAILAIFAAVALYNFKNTRKGYKLSPHLIVALSLLLSVFLGGTLFIIGLRTEFHEFLSARVPYYDRLVYTNEDIWSNVERGFLIGRLVVNDPRGGNIAIRDFNGRVWNVFLDTSSEIESTSSLNVGETLVISGWQGGGTTFLAKEVRPWRGQADDRIRNGR